MKINHSFNNEPLDSLSSEQILNSLIQIIQPDLGEYYRDVFNTSILKVIPITFAIGANYSLYGQDLDDIVQEAKLNTWISVKDLPRIAFSKVNIGQYFLACVRNGAIKFGKERSKYSYEDIDTMDTNDFPDIISQDEIPDFLMDNATKLDEIKKIISEKDFKIFELFGVHNKSYQEIADELGFNYASTVGTRINRVRKKLQLLRKKGRL